MGYRPNGVAPRPATRPPAPPKVTLRPCCCKATPEPVIVWLIDVTVGWLCPQCLADVPDPSARPPVGVVADNGIPSEGFIAPYARTWEYVAADGVSPATGSPTDVMTFAQHRTGRGVATEHDEIRNALAEAQKRAIQVADSMQSDEHGFSVSKAQYDAYKAAANDVENLRALLAITPEYVIS